jgi:hypothetical protein
VISAAERIKTGASLEDELTEPAFPEPAGAAANESDIIIFTLLDKKSA